MCQFDTFFYLTASPFPKLVMDTVEKFLTQVRQGVQNGIIVPLCALPALPLPGSACFSCVDPSNQGHRHPLNGRGRGLPIAIDYMIVQSSLEITRLSLRWRLRIHTTPFMFTRISRKSHDRSAPALLVAYIVAPRMQRRGPEYRLFVSFDRDLSAQLISGGRKSSSKSRL